MIGGVNDTELDATAMAELLRGDHAHVNLIPMNPVAHTPWTASPMPVIERFAATLRARRHRDDDPAQPGPGGRRRLRPARRGASRRAAPPVVARRRARLVRRARPRCWASAATSRSRPGWGTDRGRRAGAGRGEHPRRRPANLAYAVRRVQAAGADRSTSTSWTPTSSPT